MPDNPQILAFSADGTYQRNGPTRIRFVDSWGNQGQGSFTINGDKMQIDIDRVKVAPGGENIGRNYGLYGLSARHCKWTRAAP